MWICSVIKILWALGRVSHKLMLWRNTRWTPGSSEAVWILYYMFSFRMAGTRSSFVSISISLALALQTCIHYYCKQHQLLVSVVEIIAVPVSAGKTLTLPILVTISEKLLIQKSHSVHHKPLITPINRLVTTRDFYHSKGLGLGCEKAAQFSVSRGVLVQPQLMGRGRKLLVH